PVTVRIEGAGCLLRIIVACRQRFHGGEPTHTSFVDRRFRTTGDDHVRLSPTNVIQGVNDCRTRGGACRDGGKVGTHKAVADGDPSCGDVNNYLGDEEGVDPRSEEHTSELQSRE